MAKISAAASLAALAAADLFPAVRGAKNKKIDAASLSKSVEVLLRTYTLRLDESGNGFQFSTNPARYGYGTHRDLTEVPNGGLVGRLVVGLRPSAIAAFAKLDVYERPLTAANANTTAPGQSPSDVLVSSILVAWEDSGAAVGTNASVIFNTPTPFVRRDGYTYGLDPRFIDADGNTIATGVASNTGAHADRTALFFRTGLPNTWSNSSTLTVAIKAYQVDTVTSRDPAFVNEQVQRGAIATKVGDINASLTGWQQATYVVEEGVYYETGDGVRIATNPNYHAIRYTLAPGEQSLRFTALVSGNSTGVICFKADDSYNGVVYQGSNAAPQPYSKKVIDLTALPAGTKSIAIDGLAGSPIKLERLGVRTTIANDLMAVEDRVTTLEGLLANGGSGYFQGKKMLGIGTSIEAGFPTNRSYLTTMAADLGLVLTNKAISSSCMRRGVKQLENVLAGDTYGWNGRAWQAAFYCLGGTVAEKQDLIANYQTKWKAMLVGDGKPDTLTADIQAAIIASSFENVLATPYDVYWLGHGHNDVWNTAPDDPTRIADMSNTTSTGPGEVRDRGYFLGATMAIIDAIQVIAPDALIVIGGHYESARKQWIYLSQEKLGQLTSLPLYRAWDRLGLTQQKLVGGVNAGKTITQSKMEDDLHPGSDPTGKLPIRMGHSAAAFTNGVVR